MYSKAMLVFNVYVNIFRNVETNLEKKAVPLFLKSSRGMQPTTRQTIRLPAVASYMLLIQKFVACSPHRVIFITFSLQRGRF